MRIDVIIFHLVYHVFVSLCFPSGEGVVPEQENEVEACEGRPAGGSSSGERTGECEKRDVAAIRVFRNSRN